mgnify:FL=1
MSKVKTIEVEGKEVKSIKQEELKEIQELTAKQNEALRTLGVLESQKFQVHDSFKEVTAELDEIKKKLEEEYGQINIDLSNGEYTDIEKEDAK